ncbi:MAG: radical SAM/SPASM domain-containing protein [Candidatus Hydrothermia bacterium]
MIVSEPQLMERLAVWATRERIPLIAHFGITRHCNAKCGFCFWGDEITRRGFMPPELFQKALVEMSRMGTFEIELTGGEPTIHPDFPEFIELASQLRFVITITTNGLRLTDRALSAISEGLVAHVFVSVHGANPRTHDALVGRAGAWGKAINNIKRLINKGVNVSVCFVITRKNYREISQAREIFSSAGAGFQLVVKIYNPFRFEAIESMRLSRDELREVVRLFPEPPVRPHPCGAFMNTLYVAYNGDIWPCITLPITIGNITKNSIREIWDGLDEGSRALCRELADQREKTLYRGIDCFCPSMSKAYDGSLRGLDPYVKEIIDLWLEEREGIQETDQPPPNVSFAGDDSSTLPEIQNRSFSPARDVAFRLLEGREESFLLFWKRTGNRYIAVEGPWAEAVHSLLERGTIASSLEILEASFESINREEAIQDMQTLLSETIRMGFINPD